MNLFWQLMLNQSDRFAYETSSKHDKGGPFGSQIWLVNEGTNEYILAGTPEHPEDSNAVVSKADASAHAEAENLSPEKRMAIIDFLEQHPGEGWKVVQISSGESCPSCRSKQTALANELIDLDMTGPGDFLVAFRATYLHTSQITTFSDAPYDTLYRAILKLGILDQPNGLLGLEAALKANPEMAQLIAEGKLTYNPVEAASADNLPRWILQKFKTAQETDFPFAIAILPDGKIIEACDYRW